MASAISLGAQTSTTTAQRSSSATDKGHDVTVTGCLARGASGGYMLNNAKMENGTSTTTTTPTGSTTTGGATTTTPRSPAGGNMSNAAAMNWMLMGGSDLDKHVGHKIEVTGKTEWDHSMGRTSTSTAAGAGTTATTEPTTSTAGTTGTLEQQRNNDQHGMQPRLDVQSIKMISTTCS